MLTLCSTLFLWLAAIQVEAVDASVLDGLRVALSTAELDPGEAASLSAILDEAMADLAATTALRAEADEFSALTEAAPKRIETLRQSLSEPPIPIDPELAVDAPLAVVEDRMRLAEASRGTAASDVEELEGELSRRAARQLELTGEIAALSRELNEARAEAEAFPRGEGLAARVRGARLDARVQRLAESLRHKESELASYVARAALLPLRRDEAERRLSASEALVVALRARASVLRRAEADSLARETEAMQPSQDVALLRRITAENQAWAREHAEEVVPALFELATEVDAARDRADELESELATLREKVAVGRRSERVAIELRQRYEVLPTSSDLEGEADEHARDASDAHFRWIELRESLEEWRDVVVGFERLEPELERELARLDEADRDEPRSALRRLLETRKEVLAKLTPDAKREFELRYELEEAVRLLARRVTEARGFIEEHILWLRSVYPDRWPDGRATLEALAWLFDPESCVEGLARALGALRREPLAPIGLLGFLLFLSATRRRARERLQVIAARVASFRTDSFAWTLRALGTTLLLAGLVPLAIWTAGWLLVRPGDQVDNVRALGLGLQGTGRLLLPLTFLYRVVARGGLGTAHFRWPERAVVAVRVHLRWFLPALTPLATIAIAFERLGNAEWSHSAGRIAFCCGLALLFWLLRRVLQPRGGLAAEVRERGSGGWVQRLYRLWYPIAIGAPLILIVLGGMGWYYTAWQLEKRLEDSLGYALGVVLVHALMLRWLFVARRKLSIEQARSARQRSEATGGPEASAQPFEEDKVDIPALDQKTRQLFRTATLMASVVGFVLIWSTVLPALRILDRVEIWPEMRIVEESALRSQSPTAESAVDEAAPEAGQSAFPSVSGRLMQNLLASTGTEVEEIDPLTLADVGLALIVVLVMFAGARDLPSLLEFLLLQRLPLDAGSRYAISSVVRYLIFLLGVTSAMAAVHIGWSQIQWLAAALTFGLAFGLQEVFANFISGLIILFERPFEVGDVVTVGGIEGRVVRIRMRATLIQDWDLRELLVPNREFITGQLVNWTLTDPVSRVVVPVGIAYGSDTRLARKLLLECARACVHVLDDPPPHVVFRRFGESSLDFELRIFIPNRDVWVEATHDIHTRIDDSFRRSGIEIAFPQRDLHVRSAPGLDASFGRRDAKDAKERS